MFLVNKISGSIVLSCRSQIKKMFSNVTKPLEGKVAIVTASTDG